MRSSPRADLPHRLLRSSSSHARAALGVLRGVARVGATLALFGYAYAPTLVALALPRWAATPVPSVLSAYAVYVFAMGVNGVAEAFAGAAAGRDSSNASCARNSSIAESYSSIAPGRPRRCCGFNAICTPAVKV